MCLGTGRGTRKQQFVVFGAAVLGRSEHINLHWDALWLKLVEIGVKLFGRDRSLVRFSCCLNLLKRCRECKSFQDCKGHLESVQLWDQPLLPDNFTFYSHPLNVLQTDQGNLPLHFLSEAWVKSGIQTNQRRIVNHTPLHYHRQRMLI